MTLRRRAALGLLAVGAAAAILPPVTRWLRTPDLTYQPLPGLPGFRQLAGGGVSGGDPLRVGLDLGSEAGPASSKDICASLFDNPAPEDRVPVAYFSDARCVYCRVLSPMLHEIETDAPIHITWHELPLLGPASQRAAKANLAARRQGAYRVFHDRLMGTPFVPNDAYIRQIAEDAGIDAGQLLRDMDSDEITSTLARTARIARAFGFFGTPALVVGRTAILGTVERRQLRHVIEAELAATDPWPCV